MTGGGIEKKTKQNEAEVHEVITKTWFTQPGWASRCINTTQTPQRSANISNLILLNSVQTPIAKTPQWI